MRNKHPRESPPAADRTSRPGSIVPGSAAPSRDCALCPRLAAFREEQRNAHPAWFNAPVPPFGDDRAELLIVGLAPGLRGANRTGRPFTGDYAGVLLYGALRKFGFAEGVYDARPDDGLELRRARITNAVRCAPPENTPKPSEIATCRRFLTAEIAGMPRLHVILALGVIAHHTGLAALHPVADYSLSRTVVCMPFLRVAACRQLSLLSPQHHDRKAQRVDVRSGICHSHPVPRRLCAEPSGASLSHAGIT